MRAGSADRTWPDGDGVDLAQANAHRRCGCQDPAVSLPAMWKIMPRHGVIPLRSSIATRLARIVGTVVRVTDCSDEDHAPAFPSGNHEAPRPPDRGLRAVPDPPECEAFLRHFLACILQQREGRDRTNQARRKAEPANDDARF